MSEVAHEYKTEIEAKSLNHAQNIIDFLDVYSWRLTICKKFFFFVSIP